MFYRVLAYFSACDPIDLFVAMGGTLCLLFAALVLAAFAGRGYLGKIKKAIRKTDKFVCKNLMIKRDNEAVFFAECLAEMPAEYRRCWRAFADKGVGRAGDCFPPEAYLLGVLDAETQRGTLLYMSFAVLLVAAQAVYFLLAHTALIPALSTLFIECAVVFFAVSNYKLKRLRTVKKVPQKLEELSILLNRFVNLRPVSEQTKLRLDASVASPEKTVAESAS